MPLKIMHTADWHIRDTQYGRTFRGEDFRRAVDDAVELAIVNKVDLIINGGDTFEIARPSGPMLDHLFKIHHRLRDAGIPMFTVTGNHDMAVPSYLTFPGYADEEDLGAGVVCIDNRIVEFKGLRIAGFPGVPWQETKPLIEAWTEPVDIICWHGAVREMISFESEAAWSVEDMPAGCCRAWLMGDIHVPEKLRMPDGTLLSYPGPVELCERGEKAVKSVDFYDLPDDWRDRPFPEPMSLDLDTRPVLFLTINSEAEADQAVGRVRDAMLENKDRPPMVFMNHSRSMRHSVVRIREVIDLRKTVFRAAPSKLNYQTAPQRGQNGIGRPDMDTVVDQVVSPENPLNKIIKLLSKPSTNVRFELGQWVEERLIAISNNN